MSGSNMMLGRDGQPLQESQAEIIYYVEKSLTNAIYGESLDLGPIRTVTAFTAVKVRGNPKLYSDYGSVPIREGDVRDGLSLTGIRIYSAPFTNGVLALEVHGRP